MSERFARLFRRLKEAGEGAFVPFVTLGDPDREESARIVDTLVEAGADALELGIPFSDPLADGPVIQDGNLRSLGSGTTPDLCFELLGEIRGRYPDLPISMLVYANLVYTNGIDRFYQRAAAAGLDAMIIGDVPLEESAPFVTEAGKAGIDPVFFATPNADPATLQQVAEQSRGYVYLLSRPGVTGTDARAGMPVDSTLAELRRHGAVPGLLGFGISEPGQVREAIASGADGVICGSAVVRLIGEHQGQPAVMHQQLRDFVSRMKAATRQG